MLLQEMLPILSKQNKTVGEMLFSVRRSNRAKEAGGCLTNIIVVVFNNNMQKPEPRLCFTQLLGTASRGHKISIIHEDGLFLLMKLLLDAHCDHFHLFLLPVSVLLTTIYLYIL